MPSECCTCCHERKEREAHDQRFMAWYARAINPSTPLPGWAYPVIFIGIAGFGVWFAWALF